MIVNLKVVQLQHSKRMLGLRMRVPFVTGPAAEGVIGVAPIYLIRVRVARCRPLHERRPTLIA